MPRTDFIRNRSVGDIDPTQVLPDPDQPRKTFAEEEIQRLADDIRQRGQLQPIRVRWSASHDKWIIIAGERRWRAIQRAGIPKITCIFILAKVKNQQKQRQLADKAISDHATQPELASATKRRTADKPARRSTNETFRTADNVRITIASRRALGDHQLIQALIEIAENIRQRSRHPASKAA